MIMIRGWRLLRHYRSVAWKSHGACPMCRREIEAGDVYEAYVEVDGKGQLRVYKFHDWCPEDFWEEEEEQAREDMALMEQEENYCEEKIAA
jgi:hypothetical protein